MAVSPPLLQWCAQHGVTACGVRPAEVTDGGRGLAATRDLETGHVFLQVPEAVLVSCASARRDRQLGPLLAAHQHLDSQQVLAVHLLHEVSKSTADPVQGSIWGPYLRELPRSYTTLSYFPEAAVQQLQVPAAKVCAREAVQKLQDQWQEAKSILVDLGVLPKLRTFAAWRWAACTLLSRTMFVPWDSAGCLTPLGDLLNHQNPPPPCTTRDNLLAPLACGQEASPAPVPALPPPPAEAEAAPAAAQGQSDDRECSWGDGAFDDSSKCYQLAARRRYQCGEQVYVSYGQHTNLELLSLYGFVLLPNPHDKVEVPLQLMEVVCQSAAVLRACEGQGPTKRAALLAAHQQRVQQAATGKLACTEPPSGSSPGTRNSGDLLNGLEQKECFVHEDGSPSWHLLQTLRSAAASKRERETQSAQLAAGERLSAAGDAQVLQWLSTAAAALLAALPTTLAEDEQQLEQPAGTGSSSQAAGRTDAGGVVSSQGLSEHDLDCLQLALQWRIGYKRVLRATLSLCQQGAQLLA